MDSAESLREKLKQLAAEYNAVAARLSKKSRQNAVLKRAVLEEKKLTEELRSQVNQLQGKLEDSSRMNQEKLRKIDRLSFNNQALRKRCEKLKKHIRTVAAEKQQQDSKSWGLTSLFGVGASSMTASSSSSSNDNLRGKSSASVSSSSSRTGASAGRREKSSLGIGGDGTMPTDHPMIVLQEELTNKIKENQSLHIELSELKQQHSQQVNDFQNEVNQLKTDNTSLRSQCDTATNRVTSLESSVAELKKAVDAKESEYRQLTMVQGITDKQAQSQLIQITNKVQKLESHVRRHVFFKDRQDAKLEVYCLPLFDCNSLASKRRTISSCLDTSRKLQLHLISLLRQIAQLVSRGVPSRAAKSGDSSNDNNSDESQKFIEACAAEHSNIVKLIPMVDGAAKQLCAYLEKAHEEIRHLCSSSSSSSSPFSSSSAPSLLSTLAEGGEGEGEGEELCERAPSSSSSVDPSLILIVRRIVECCLKTLNGLESALELSFFERRGSFSRGEEESSSEAGNDDIKGMCRLLRQRFQSGIKHLDWVEDFLNFAAERSCWGGGRAHNTQSKGIIQGSSSNSSSSRDGSVLWGSARRTMDDDDKGRGGRSEIPVARQRVFASVLSNPRISVATEWLLEGSSAYQTMLLLALGARTSDISASKDDPTSSHAISFFKYVCENVNGIAQVVSDITRDDENKDCVHSLLYESGIEMSKQSQRVCSVIEDFCDIVETLTRAMHLRMQLTANSSSSSSSSSGSSSVVSSFVPAVEEEGEGEEIKDDDAQGSGSCEAVRSAFVWSALNVNRARTHRFLVTLNRVFDSNNLKESCDQASPGDNPDSSQGEHQVRTNEGVSKHQKLHGEGAAAEGGREEEGEAEDCAATAHGDAAAAAGDGGGGGGGGEFTTTDESYGSVGCTITTTTTSEGSFNATAKAMEGTENCGEGGGDDDGGGGDDNATRSRGDSMGETIAAGRGVVERNDAKNNDVTGSHVTTTESSSLKEAAYGGSSSNSSSSSSSTGFSGGRGGGGGGGDGAEKSTNDGGGDMLQQQQQQQQQQNLREERTLSPLNSDAKVLSLGRETIPSSGRVLKASDHQRGGAQSAQLASSSSPSSRAYGRERGQHQTERDTRETAMIEAAALLFDDARALEHDAKRVVVESGVWATIRHSRREMERLHTERSLADAKAVQLHLLLQKTASRLFKVTEYYNEAKERVHQQADEIEKLAEDLSSSKQHYEKMIQDLTVHVCNLTEKLATSDARL